jgi:nicotinate-nucleotide pyrophosphorylase (carboxylating)
VTVNDDIINILENALTEDLGTAGDITSLAIFSDDDAGRAQIRAKQTGVLSGVTLIAPLFEIVDARLSASTPAKAELCCRDGDKLEPGSVICNISGSVKSILSGERTILNLLQRLSGIATAASVMCGVLRDTSTRLLDTRKTTPGLRSLEKAAVRHGGGDNHRFGLYDMILIKDTHVKRAGGIKPALTKALAWRGEKKSPHIEIEVQSIEEFMEALPLGPDRIMLDNMSLDEIESCVKKRDTSPKNITLEASGGISLAALPAIAATGVDFISSGAITHSAPALDIHLVMV